MRRRLIAVLPWLVLVACTSLEDAFAKTCRGRGLAAGTAEMARCMEEQRVAQREHTSQVVRVVLAQHMAIAGRR